ncbi:MAG: hypothetical protein ACSHX9_09805 [Luteolibacter sp.]
MKLSSAIQTDLTEIEDLDFDLLLAASGFEARATFGSEKALETAVFRRKIALGFPDRITGSRQENDESFKSLGFDLVQGDGNRQEIVRDVLSETLASRSANTALFRVLVDYSSMTKTWYAAVLNWVREIDNSELTIEVYFFYSCSNYSAPRAAAPNSYAGAIKGFSSLRSPRCPTALIVGLGYQTERAVGLVEYLEPDETHLFYTDPASDKRFVKAVTKNNSALIENLGEGRVFNYPYSNLRTTSLLLASLALGLARTHRLILAPLGPKPFSLLCLLLAYEHPDSIDVWRVGSGSQGQPYPRRPSGELIICKTVFFGIA